MDPRFSASPHYSPQQVEEVEPRWSIAGSLFSFSGRRRRRYWWMTQFLVFISIVVGVALFEHWDSSSPDTAIAGGQAPGTVNGGLLSGTVAMMEYLVPLAMVAIYLALVVISWANSVKRLHDMDKSGAFIVLGFIPGVSLLFLLWLGLFPGTIGDNKYGPGRWRQGQ